MCEEFACLPSAALRELNEAPWPLVLDVIDLRAFARAKQTVESTKKLEDLDQRDPMIRRVLDVEFRIAEQARERRRG